MKKRISTIILATALVGAALAQNNGMVTGKVLDATTMEPAPFANVIVLGTNYGDATDIEGTFEITNVPPGSYQVRASSVGYQAKTKTDVIVSNARPVELEFRLPSTAVELNEVTVTSDYFTSAPTEVNSVRTLGYEELRRSPGGFEDVLRAVAVLPGVAQADAGRNDLVVRGGAPSENLYLVDGVPVPNINHFGTQGATGGPTSYVNLDFVENVAFSTGGFPVVYGDKLSSTLRVDLREGRKDQWGGKATVAATQFGLNLEGPIGEKANVLFSIRRSYLDFIFKAADFGFVPEYYDLFLKATYEPSPENKFSFFTIGAYDVVNFFNDTEEQKLDNWRILGTDQTQYFAAFTWRRLLDDGYVNSSVSRVYTDYDSRQDSFDVPIFRNQSLEVERTFKTELVYQFMEFSETHVGGSATLARADNRIFFPSAFVTTFGETLPTNDIDETHDYLKWAAFANWTQTFAHKLTVNLGARTDYFDGIDDKQTFSPRASAAYRLSDLFTISASVGVYHQAPSYIWLADGDRNDDLKQIRATQYVGGVAYRLREDSRVNVEAYVKDYADYPTSTLRPYLALANTGGGFGGPDDNYSAFGLEDLTPKAEGYSRGVEFSAQKKLSELPFYGIMSVTLGETHFTALDGVERPGLYDQRVIVSASGGYQPNERWIFSAKFQFATGRPHTPYYAPNGWQKTSEYLSERLDPTHRLDLRVDRRWFFDWGTLIAFLDVQNVYNRNNVQSVRWDYAEQKEDRASAIGVLPSIGLSLEL
jgi:hypothetical protein